MLKATFGANTLMADEGVLQSSLVVASYQLDYDRCADLLQSFQRTNSCLSAAASCVSLGL